MASVGWSDMTPRQVGREFRSLLTDGSRMRPAGEAREDPPCLLSGGYTPRYKIELFDTTYYLTNVRENPDIRFFVAYVVCGRASATRRDVFPRIFYKDISLVWRCASHFIFTEEENWIGKGDLRTVIEDGEEVEYSAESTTDLPLEIQTALETLSRKVQRVLYDEVALDLVLRRGGLDRLEPYRDFTEPRRRASANPRNLINKGESIARFIRKHGEGVHHLSFSAPDLEAALDRLAEAGGRVLRTPSYYRAPDGGRLVEAFLHPKDFHGVLFHLAEAG